MGGRGDCPVVDVKFGQECEVLVVAPILLVLAISYADDWALGGAIVSAGWCAWTVVIESDDMSIEDVVNLNVCCKGPCDDLKEKVVYVRAWSLKLPIQLHN
jgi:hypothetical protein